MKIKIISKNGEVAWKLGIFWIRMYNRRNSLHICYWNTKVNRLVSEKYVLSDIEKYTLYNENGDNKYAHNQRRTTKKE